MSTEKGYSNSKKYGRPQHKTIHNVGGDAYAPPSIIKSLQAISGTLSVEAVEVSQDQKLIKITITGHGASKGETVKFLSGNLFPYDTEIVNIVDVDNFIIYNTFGVPSIGDTLQIARFSTGVFGSDNTTSFIKDGNAQVVTEDNTTPSNNAPLPSGLYIRKNGINLPVTDDADPADVVAVPVTIKQVDGTNINITAGDINVQLTDQGANPDVVRIGDGTNQLGVNASNEALVHDDDVLSELIIIENTVATETTLDAVKTAVESIDTDGAKEVTLDAVKTAVESIASEDFATETTLNAIKTAVELIDDTVNTDGNPSGNKGVSIGGIDSNGDFQQVSVNPSGEMLVNFGGAGFATETTLDELNDKVSNNYGASSGAVRTASQIGNSTGQADFNSGADSAQTLRVSANLKRSGNELSYNTGAPDANTLRTAIATGHGLATEAKQNDNIAELVDINSKIGDLTDSPATDPSDTVGMLPFLKAILGALQGAIQTTEGTFTGNVISAQKTVGLTVVRATVSGSAPSSSRKKLMIKPSKNNSGSIYLGSSLVTTANGLEIIGPDRLEFNLDATDYYLISDMAGQTVEIIEVE